MKKFTFLHPKSHRDFGTDPYLHRDSAPDPNPDPVVRGADPTIRISASGSVPKCHGSPEHHNRNLDCVGLSCLGMVTQFASVCLVSSPSQTPSQAG